MEKLNYFSKETSESISLPILHSEDSLVVFSKPAEDEELSFSDKFCGDLLEKIEKTKKPFCGISSPAYIFRPDTEISGITIIAEKTSEKFSLWRNALGSGQFLFTYLFLAKIDPSVDFSTPIICQLPIAKHFVKNCALISHSTGKKSETTFFLKERFGKWGLFEAKTNFPRFHQIRLHAVEEKFSIVGESVYTNEPHIMISQLQAKGRLNKGEDKAFYPFICLHLSQIEINSNIDALPKVTITAPLPKGFEVLLKKLK